MAPADGVVLTRSVDPGNAVAASLQAVTLFSVAEDLGKLLRFTPNTAAAKTATKNAVLTSLTPRMPGGPRRTAAAGASTASARQVWVLGVDGTPQAVAVTPGISNGRMTEITAGDLKVGMQVITNQKVAASK